MKSRAFRSAALILALAVVPMVGCQKPSAAPGDTEPQPLGAPRFVDPATGASVAAEGFALDFGSVRVMSSQHREVLIRNEGLAAFTVTGFEPLNDFPPGFIYSPAPCHVEPGDEAAFAISFRPTAAGKVRGSLKLLVANGDPSALYILVSGTGLAAVSPLLDLTPADLAFGDVDMGTSASLHVALANTGADVPGTTDDNLRFDTPPAITGPDAAEFAVLWPPSGYSAQGLASGEVVDLRVAFTAGVSEGPKRATLVITSNDPARPQVELSLHGLAVPFVPCDLEVTPPALNFGTLEMGTSLTFSVSIRDHAAGSTHTCRIANLDLSPETKVAGMFSLPNGPLEDAVVPAGGTLSVPVRFQPGQGGTCSGELVFYVYAPSLTPITIPVSGVGFSACLSITPSLVDFGTTRVNCNSRQRIFTMTNVCASNVVVTAIDMRRGPSNEFSITKKPALPVTITGGAMSDFGVTYHPIDIGDDTGAVGVEFDGNPNPLLIPLQARGATDLVQTDVITGPPLPKRDILFVVDNSSSMADKQTNLSRNFATFAHYAMQQQRYDLHIAVTTTDVSSTGAAGRLLPLTGTNPRVVTAATPNAEQVFSQNADVGTSGSETESLLRPAYLALSSPLVTGDNAGFYRPDAKLAIIIVSDAADQDPLSTSVSDYVAFFTGLKDPRRRSDVTVSGIIPILPNPPAECAYDSPTAGLDPRVMDAIRDTGGLLDEICNPDWFKTLEKMGPGLLDMRISYFLSDVPDMSVAPDPIIITIDHLPFPQYGAKGDKRWDYNSASNAVEFDPLAVLGPGSTMEVSYHVACLQ